MPQPNHGSVRPIILASEADWPEIAAKLSPDARAYAEGMGFKGASGKVLPLPGPGGIHAVLFGTGSDQGLKEQPFLLGKLAGELPAGHYRLEAGLAAPELSYLAFLLGRYRFTSFKSQPLEMVELEPPGGIDLARITTIAEAVNAGRELINRPANDLTTVALADAAQALAARYGAACTEIVGEDLRSQNFPLIHAVGAASAHAPRLIDIRWGEAVHPKVTLVGKGVVFDTGGLNLKPDASMLLMKKDMGGAAAAITAARIMMELRLPVCLRLLLPIVENSVSAPAFRPGDVFRSRAGVTVEIGNTDAEGRLILCDTLAFADEEKPELLIDFATLTGAARVALGPDLPPFYTENDAIAGEIAAIGQAVQDPVWRLPLWKPYRAMIDSKVADINNSGQGGFAGSITAALFLKDFVKSAGTWVHFDIYGWVPSPKPGRPEGGEPQAARLIAAFVEKWAKERTGA